MVQRGKTMELTENALRVLKARYLRRDKSGEIRETPGQLFERVARFDRSCGALEAVLAKNLCSVASFNHSLYLITATEQGACHATFAETLPSMLCLASLDPVAPSMMRSYPPFSASPKITVAGLPSSIIEITE